MKTPETEQGDLASDGFTIVPEAFPPSECSELAAAIAAPAGANRRHLLANPRISCFARSEPVLNLLRPYMAAEPEPVRAIFFDKTPDRNWSVTWHQDLTLAVREKADMPGFGPWTEKGGIPHVHAPMNILDGMLTIRIHFDDANETNGALCVIPGSHLNGRLGAAQIARARQSALEHPCHVRAGDALLMRPLLLHASHKSTSPAQRRVLHIEYAAFKLPAPLKWHDAA